MTTIAGTVPLDANRRSVFRGRRSLSAGERSIREQHALAVFAASRVRRGSMKQDVAVVGKGASAVTSVHRAITPA
jgi:hypothetical protein